jgi:predicted acetyltransferase
MLRLRPVRRGDEEQFRAGHEQMAAEGFAMGFLLEPETPWDDYVRMLAGFPSGCNLPDGWVPNTFLVAEVDGQIVGRVSIRHQLNEFLARRGGHIGYCVLAPNRRRGYATEILRQALVIARSLGIDPVLVTCDDDNVGSIKVIEACGGKLDSVLEADQPGRAPLRRYWID